MRASASVPRPSFVGGMGHGRLGLHSLLLLALSVVVTVSALLGLLGRVASSTTPATSYRKLYRSQGGASSAGTNPAAAAVPASLLYQGIRRASLRQLAWPATTEAGVVRVLHWASVSRSGPWAGALPIEAIRDLYPTACGGMPSPAHSELHTALGALERAQRVTAANSTPLFIGPHYATWVVYKLRWRPAPLFELVLQATHGGPPSVVNLGAGHYWEKEDADADPTYRLLQEHPGGASLLVEANAESLSKTLERLRAGGARGIFGVNALITPGGVVQLLEDAGVSRVIDLLKIDIDGFDCSVVGALLRAGFAPSLIAAEVNPDFPPPLAFEVGFSNLFRIATGTAGFFGCSCARWGEIGREHGYVLLQGDTEFSSHDVVLVRLDLLPLFESRFNVAHDALTAFRMMSLANNVGAHWTDPSPLSFIVAAEEWGGALAQLPRWYEQMHVRALIHNDGAAAGPFTLRVDSAPPDALALIEGWGAGTGAGDRASLPPSSPPSSPRSQQQQQQQRAAAHNFPVIEVAFPNGRRRNVSDSEPSRASFWRGLLSWDGHDGVFRLFDHYLSSGRFESYMGFGEWIGPTALVAAPLVQRVFALEPDPLCRRHLEENVAANPDVAAKTLVSGLCIAPEAGTHTLMGEGGSGSFLSDVASNATREWEKRVRSWTVDCVTLPSFLREHSMEPGKTFLKMDTEGAEWQLLPSLHDWLAGLAGSKPTMLISFHMIDGKEGALEGVLRTLHLFSVGGMVASSKDVRGRSGGVTEDSPPSSSEFPVTTPATSLTAASLMEHDYFDVLVSDW